MDSLDFVNPYLYRYKKRNFLVKDKMRPKDLDELQHFEIQPTDIFLVTYPKSGQYAVISAKINTCFFIAQTDYKHTIPNMHKRNQGKPVALW